MISLAHTSLVSYYQLNFVLKLNHYGTEEVENWVPFERDLYLSLLQDHIEKLNKNAANT